MDAAAAQAERERLALAEAFLTEAVYRSRARQAAASSIAASAAPAGGGQCGLGERAAVVLDLAPRGEQLFAELWPAGLPPESVQALRERMQSWILRQDELDRGRNHFLKGFRARHGFEKRAYSPEQRQAYEDGLLALNERALAELREAARALAALG